MEAWAREVAPQLGLEAAQPLERAVVLLRGREVVPQLGREVALLRGPGAPQPPEREVVLPRGREVVPQRPEEEVRQPRRVEAEGPLHPEEAALPT